MTNLTKKIDLNKGYNPTGNLIIFHLLKELDPNDERKCREELRKQDPIKYEEYLTYEEYINGQI